MRQLVFISFSLFLVACSRHEMTTSVTVVNNSRYVIEAYPSINLQEGNLGASCSPNGAIIPNKEKVQPGETRDFSVSQKCDSSINMAGEAFVGISTDNEELKGDSVYVRFPYDAKPYLKDVKAKCFNAAFLIRAVL